MKKRSIRFLIFSGLLLTTLFLHNRSNAQTDSTAEKETVQPVTDSVYSNEEGTADENTQDFEDSVRRAKANAFELPDTAGTSALQQRSLDGSFIQKLKNDKAFSYVQHGIPTHKEKERKSFPFDIGNVLLALAIIAFIAFLVWYLSENDLLFFRKKAASIAEMQGQPGEKDIFSINYPDAIQEALKNNNYRLAVRLQYLQLLKLLSDKGIISYQSGKTNFDYLLQLKPTAYYNEFFNITRNYEYSWYGLFDIDEARYSQVKNAFSDFKKKISV